MKAFYLTLSIILTVVILVVAFGNIGANFSQFNFFGVQMRANPTIIILLISVLGILTGMTYHAFFARLLESEDEDTVEM